MDKLEDIQTFPDIPLSRVKRSRFWVVEGEVLANERDVSDLIARLYDYPEDAFYLFQLHKHPTPPALQAAVDGEVIALTEWELDYYAHPRFKHDYVYLNKSSLHWQWEYEVVANSPMFVRVELKLTAKARRALEHQQLIAAQKYAARNPVELKPNFMGLGIDVYKALDWVLSMFRRGNK